MDKFNKDRGFVSIILIIIVALAALKYFFNWSIFDAFHSEQGRATITYIKEIFNYIKGVIIALWNYIH